MTIKVADDKEKEKDIPIITDAVVVVDEEANTPMPASAPMDKYNKDGKGGMVVQGTKVPPATTTNMVAPSNYSQLGRNSAGLQCPHCKRQTVTVPKDLIGFGTIVSIVILAILFWPVCWLPLCVPSCKRTKHYCGHDSCGKHVGTTAVCA